MIRLFLAALCLPLFASATQVYDTRHRLWLSLEDWARSMTAGEVLVLGEQHATGSTPGEVVHHNNQILVLGALGAVGAVSLGMEFFEYPKQGVLNQYLLGGLGEAEFLRDVGWGGNAWPLYRDQVRLPARFGGWTYALNIPRSISGQVGRGGRESLSETDRGFLPPIWEAGSDSYLARFREVMGGHVSEDRLQNYFWAQSLWDDTMAWRVRESRDPSAGVFVVIAGEFHVEFGHGLPARLSRYGIPSVKTMIQAESRESATAEDPVYGPRADYILVNPSQIETFH